MNIELHYTAIKDHMAGLHVFELSDGSSARGSLSYPARRLPDYDGSGRAVYQVQLEINSSPQDVSPSISDNESTFQYKLELIESNGDLHFKIDDIDSLERIGDILLKREDLPETPTGESDWYITINLYSDDEINKKNYISTYTARSPSCPSEETFDSITVSWN